MILDNEEQRKLLLQIITSTNINGFYQVAKEAILLLDNLIESVNNAEIGMK
jgi:hypothetical protein